MIRSEDEYADKLENEGNAPPLYNLWLCDQLGLSAWLTLLPLASTVSDPVPHRLVILPE